MSYQVFARKYRPKTFADVLGQDHVVRTLRNAIEQDRLAHAYLFVGPRGTGKTSTARIFAKALNCPGGPKIDFDPEDPVCREIAEGNSLDVLEIDGASNNGVDQVRDLRDTVKYAPSSGRFKIYYIDEVHMLTTAAFNALLKTLEEPPPHVKFIFATTEPNKILPTIISRCQRFDLRRIPTPLIAEHLLHIAKLEGVDLDEKAAYEIGKGADGGMRDAQSMLDQLVAFCGNRIEEANVLEIFGFTAGETVASLAGCLLASDTVGALRVVHEQTEAGKDLGRLLADLIQHVRTLLVCQVDAEAALEDLSPEVAQMVVEQAGQASAQQLLRMVDGLAEVDARMRWASNKRLHFELGVIQAVQALNEVSLDEVIAALDQGQSGGAVRGVASAVRRAAAPEVRTKPQEPRPVVSAEPTAAAGTSLRDLVSGTAGGSTENRSPTVEAAPAPARQVAAEARPAAPAEPEQTAAASVEPMTEEAFWSGLLAQVNQRRPLTLHWVQVATLRSIEAGRVVLAFPKTEEAARESLMRPTTMEFLEEVSAALLGRRVKLELVIDPSLQASDTFELAFGSAPEAPVAAPASSATEQAPQPSAEEPSAPEASLYDDPVIKRAVERFKLKLVSPAEG